jgi:hypothetical protein
MRSEGYLISHDSLDNFLGQAIDVRTPDGKAVHTGIHKLAQEWSENAIDLDMVNNCLEKIRENCENAKKYYIDQNYSDCFEMIEDTYTRASDLFCKFYDMKQKDYEISEMTMEEFDDKFKDTLEARLHKVDEQETPIE